MSSATREILTSIQTNRLCYCHGKVGKAQEQTSLSANETVVEHILQANRNCSGRSDGTAGIQLEELTIKTQKAPTATQGQPTLNRGAIINNQGIVGISGTRDWHVSRSS